VNHYIDIRLRPDPDFPPNTLLDVLFAKVHRALARHGRGDIGVSFPGYDGGRRLGTQLRLHSQAETLSQLMTQTWLTGLHDHVIVSQPNALPLTVQYRTVRRVQAKSNPARLRRRQVRRHGLNEQQALEKIPDSVQERLVLPYVRLKSTSTGHAFPLFIQHGPPQEVAHPGYFSSYGLSDTATVPWF
jgi:CRISPR-associated endonuclease Csy4